MGFEISKSFLNMMAVKTRREFENHQVDALLLQRLYEAYNPEVEDARLFVERGMRQFPSLNCGLASVYLRKALGTGKVINGKYLEQNHTFLLIENFYDDAIVIDITADQYGGPPIYVGPVQAPWSLRKSSF